MNIALCKRPLEGFTVNQEYAWKPEKYANGKEIVDLYEKNQRKATCTVEVFDKHFIKVRIV